MPDHPMRILHLNARADCGGAETLILGFLEHSAGRGDVTATAMADGPWRDRFAEAGAAWFELPLVARSPLRLPGFVRRIRGIIAEFRPEVVHAHNPTMMIGAAAATARPGRRRVGLVGTLHGNGGADYRREALIARAFPGEVIAVTPHIAGELDRAGVRGVRTITSGVGPAPAPATRAALAERFGIPAGPPLIAGVGRLVECKRWHLAIEAVGGVPGAHLVIFGEGPLRAELERCAAGSPAAGRVHLPGAVDDVQACAGAADAALLTTSGEGFSLVALEALAAGVPLVAADVPGVSDVVDGASAAMVDPVDVAGTAGALRAVLAGGPAVRTRVAAGRTVAARHSRERMNERYFAAYRRAAR